MVVLLVKVLFTAVNYSSRAEIYLNTKLLEFKVSDLRKIMKRNNNFANKMINNLAQYIVRLENLNKIELPPIEEIDKKKQAENEIKKQSLPKKKAIIKKTNL